MTGSYTNNLEAKKISQPSLIILSIKYQCLILSDGRQWNCLYWNAGLVFSAASSQQHKSMSFSVPNIQSFSMFTAASTLKVDLYNLSFPPRNICNYLSKCSNVRYVFLLSQMGKISITLPICTPDSTSRFSFFIPLPSSP